jgi:hypothetical protein
MKKYFLIGLIVAIMPNICAAESASVSNLIREKQRKMEELEKCMGASKGLKIAGISTLGVTAAGVAGNIVEAKVLSDYDKKIETADKKIESAKTELANAEQCKAQGNVYQDGKCVAANDSLKDDGVVSTIRIFHLAANNGLLCKTLSGNKDKLTNSSETEACAGMNKGEFEIKSGNHFFKGASGCFSSSSYYDGQTDSGPFCWCKITDSNVIEKPIRNFEYGFDFQNNQDCLSKCAAWCFQQEVPDEYGSFAQ